LKTGDLALPSVPVFMQRLKRDSFEAKLMASTPAADSKQDSIDAVVKAWIADFEADCAKEYQAQSASKPSETVSDFHQHIDTWRVLKDWGVATLNVLAQQTGESRSSTPEQRPQPKSNKISKSAIREAMAAASQEEPKQDEKNQAANESTAAPSLPRTFLPIPVPAAAPVHVPATSAEPLSPGPESEKWTTDEDERQLSAESTVADPSPRPKHVHRVFPSPALDPHGTDSAAPSTPPTLSIAFPTENHHFSSSAPPPSVIRIARAAGVLPRKP